MDPRIVITAVSCSNLGPGVAYQIGGFRGFLSPLDELAGRLKIGRGIFLRILTYFSFMHISLSHKTFVTCDLNTEAK